MMSIILKKIQQKFQKILGQKNFEHEIQKLPENTNPKDIYMAGFISGFWEGAALGLDVQLAPKERMTKQ